MNLQPTILIVDDNQENLVYLKYVTIKLNVKIIQALSGYEALEKTKGIGIALAIIDVQMPVMSGYELALKLNEDRLEDKVPVIFLTASHVNELEEFKGYSYGAVDYIFKPVTSHILLSKITVFLNLYEQKLTILRNSELLKEIAEELSRTNDALQKREEKLQQEQLFTKALLDSIPGIFYLYSYPELRMVTWNKQHETLFGYDTSEMKGRHVLEWHQPESRDAVIKSLENFVESGQATVEAMLLAKDGHSIPFLLTAVKFESNGQDFLIGIGTDVTKRKQAEEALLESEATLTKAQQIAHLGNWELDSITQTMHWSDETYRIFGYEPHTVRPSMELFFSSMHTDDTPFMQRAISDAWNSGTPFSRDQRLVLPGGEIRFVHEQAEIMFDHAGKPQKWVGTIQDITERKRIEEELKSSLEQLKQLSQYIETVRENERIAISRELHDDLGQALTAVKIDLGIIKHKILDEEVVLKINKVTALVGDTIKTVQRLTSQLRPEIIDDLGLEAAIEWYTNEFSERTAIEISLDMDTVNSISSVDSLIIFRILQESLTNIARHSKATKVDIKLSIKEDSIGLRISDNGIGITEEQRNSRHAFGLISMKERAASLGGTFDISSENGNGTIIRLLIPVKHMIL
ncbi:MAG: PAS domain S-box protein [Bacteroidales bacterium]|nr:PAS domain S-box protein [Bacteroidales bacterium]